MDEHPVAAATHEEGYGLVHVRRLGTVGGAGPKDHPLAALVQARKGLPAPEKPLVGGKREGRRKVAVQIVGAAHEREGDGQRVEFALASEGCCVRVRSFPEASRKPRRNGSRSTSSE